MYLCTHRGMCIKKSFSEKLLEILIFHILAQHISQATQYPAEIPFIICKLPRDVLFIICFDIKIKMLIFSVSVFLMFLRRIWQSPEARWWLELHN